MQVKTLIPPGLDSGCRSCKIAVQLTVALVALQELPLDQALNALLDQRGRGHEARRQLLRHLFRPRQYFKAFGSGTRALT